MELRNIPLSELVRFWSMLECIDLCKESYEESTGWENSIIISRLVPNFQVPKLMFSTFKVYIVVKRLTSIVVFENME